MKKKGDIVYGLLYLKLTDLYYIASPPFLRHIAHKIHDHIHGLFPSADYCIYPPALYPLNRSVSAYNTCNNNNNTYSLSVLHLNESF